MAAKTRKKTALASLRATVPVMFGYLAIGIAFGVLLQEAGYGFIWAAFMGVIIFAGSMQYVAVSMLAAQAGLVEVAVMTLVINARHIMYGLSMLDRFKTIGGKRAGYMIFALTDETYALLCGTSPPQDVDEKDFYFFISVFNQIYWVLGSVIGALLGRALPVNTAGIEFAMTALFIVICVEQWQSGASHACAGIGAFMGILCLAVFGADNMLIPAMLGVVATLVAFRPYLQKSLYAQDEEE